MAAFIAGEDIDLPFWLIDGSEEGVTLYVVPMAMGKDNVYVVIITYQFLSQ
jgi:hypothetical protein